MHPRNPHSTLPAIGVLLTNLGTPEAPTAPALRRYLAEFLSDPRVIELPRWKWLPILHLFILTTRPKASAALYRKVWTAEGSPLLSISKAQLAGVGERLAQEIGSPLHFALGMRYGNPSVASALAELAAKGCRRILVLPLYPQYAAATTGSTFDALASALTRTRWVPELRMVGTYHDQPGYVAALAASIRELWGRDGEPERLLFSFHGIPQRYFDAGDPYHCLCHKTARLVAESLGLPAERWVVCFQSLFGKEEWIKPYTASTVEALARSGLKRLDVICPGFSADCLETLEEIDQLNREIFLHHGGERFRYVPALNDRPDHLRFLADLALANLGGWVVPREEWDEAAARAAGEASAERARRLAEKPARADGGFGP
ncbi:MAG TPA: ferrochelatase [Thermoanaerobaculia bacterium]|nr:ferrochelatase [Thermoanaerobaculia bacterium]